MNIEIIKKFVKESIEKNKNNNGNYKSYKIELDEEKYVIGICTRDVTVWSRDGMIGLGETKCPFENVESAINKITEYVVDWSEGYIRCADCEKKVKFEDIKYNQYFAGFYCDDCWNNKWKAIEARETYN